MPCSSLLGTPRAGAPRRLQSPVGPTAIESSSAKPRDGAQTSSRCCARRPGIGFSCLQEGCTQSVLRNGQCWKGACQLPLEGASPHSSHQPACPMGTQFDGTQLRIRWQCRNPSSAYQPAVSILAGEMGTQTRLGTFCFCPCITFEPSASAQNPLCIYLLHPKGEGRGTQILSLHNTPGKVSVFVDGGCKTCTLVTGAAGTYQQR